MKPKKRTSTNNNKQEFAVGDLVGAKVKGHSLWPGKIEKIELKGSKKDYVVKFFATNDSANKFAEIKLFSQYTEAQLNPEKNQRNAQLRQAIEMCRQEFDKLKGRTKETQDKQEHDGHVGDHNGEFGTLTTAEDENKLTINKQEEAGIIGSLTTNVSIAKTKTKDSKKKTLTKIKLDTQREIKMQIADLEQGVKRSRPRRNYSEKKREPEEGGIEKSSDTSHLDQMEDASHNLNRSGRSNGVRSRPDRRVPSKTSLPKTIKPNRKVEHPQKEASTPISKVQQDILGTTSDSSPNNDLMENYLGESVYYDAEEKSLIDQSKNNLSLSKSMIDHNSRMFLDEDKNPKNSALEKLKKKIAMKLHEKEVLKSTLKQKKKFERAATKFPKVFKRLELILSLSEKLATNRKGDRAAANQLENAHKNLRKMLERTLLELTTDYAKRQQETKKFQVNLIEIVRNLKRIREGDKNMCLSKIARRLLTEDYKASKAIKHFINDANLNDAISERKENDAIKME